MKNKTDDEELMSKYLLGDLSEDDRLQVEERFLRDPAYLEQLQALEAELNDDYVRGELTEREREQFAQRSSASPEWRRRVGFAKALITGDESATATTAPAKVSPAPPPRWRSLLPQLRLPKPALTWALAAAFLVMSAAGSWLVLETSRLRAQLEQMQAERKAGEQQAQALRQQAAEQRARNDQLAAQLQREQDQQRQWLAEAGRPQPHLLSFILAPGLGRGADESTKLLVPPEVQTVRLRLYLEGAGEYQSYRAELHTSADKLIWSRDRLRAQPIRTGKAVVLSLPASLLTTGEYEVRLKGAVSREQIEEIGDYFFSVSKK